MSIGNGAGSMTKAELVEEVSRVSDLTKKHSEVIVDTVFKSIIDALHRGEKIELRGFGSFRLRKREPRKGRNPKTGDKVDVPPKKVPYFKPGKELKELINREAEAEDAAAGLAGVPDEPDPLVVWRGTLAYVILNLYPYNNGHLMVVPCRHEASLAGLTREEMNEVGLLVQRGEAALREAYRLEGINVGVNLGAPAGAGIEEHVHVHLVPRWTGDTNFMTVVGGTRVLPEDMRDTAARLRPIFERLA